MKTNSFDKTGLWLELKSRGEDVTLLRDILKDESCLPTIEKILSHGGTSPNLYTLHDADHSFRVAEKMVEVMGENALKGMSPFELGLLLLAAYLHDIGMTPPEQKLDAYKEYLRRSRSHVGLNDNEIKEFEHWGELVNRSSFVDQDQLLFDFVRHKHNDWSAEWIRNPHNLKCLKSGDYDWFIDDLVRLCTSHHDGYEQLRQPRFEERRADGVYLRYLACVLRLADVLEISPDRAPFALLAHRNVSGLSRDHWLKEHFLKIPFYNNLSYVICSGRPTSAKIHRLMEEVSATIHEQLQLCHRLSVEHRFDKQYKWIYATHCFAEINEPEEKYYYIQGNLRPSSKCLTRLYTAGDLASSIAFAARQLIQNGFDAVRERIAYEHRSEPEQGNVVMGFLDLCKDERVRVILTIHCSRKGSESKLTLRCRDYGVGMDHHIIQDDFLAPGESRRPDIIALRWDCHTSGAELVRAGSFGLGALSFFLICDELKLLTVRDIVTMRSEGTAWQFVTHGAHDFGELTKASNWFKGTDILITVGSQIGEKDVLELGAAVWNEICGCLVHSPCVFEIRMESDVGAENKQSRKYSAGWIEPDANRTISDYCASDESRGLESRMRSAGFVYFSMLGEDQIVTIQGTKIGLANRSVAVYSIRDAACLAWLPVNEEGTIERYVTMRDDSCQPLFFRQRWPILESWCGMRINPEGPEIDYQLAIDWRSSFCGMLSFRGENLELCDEAKREKENITGLKLRDLLPAALREKLLLSRYATINARLIGCRLLETSPLCWAIRRSDGRAVWAEIKYPGYIADIVEPRWWNGKEVQPLISVYIFEKGSFWNDVAVPFFPRGTTPRLVATGSRLPDAKLALLWASRDETRPVRAKGWHACTMSDRWRSVLVCWFPQYQMAVFNQTHPLYSLGAEELEVDAEVEPDRARSFASLAIPAEAKEREQVLSSRRRAARWLLNMCNGPTFGLEDFLEILIRQARLFPDFFPQLWDRLGIKDFDIAHSSGKSIRISATIDLLRQSEPTKLVDPGSDWLLSTTWDSPNAQ